MALKGKKRYILLALFIAGMALVVIFGRTILLSQLRSKLEDQLYRLRDAGYMVAYDSIRVDWRNNQVEVENLLIKDVRDTSACAYADFIHTRKIRARGLNVLTLLLKRHLQFQSIEVDSAHFVINENFLKKDSTERKRKEFTIVVDDVSMPAMSFRYYDSKTCRTGSTFKGNVSIKGFNLAIYEERPIFVDIESAVSENIEINIPDEFYLLKVRRFTFNPSLKILDIDTIRIKPYYNKIAFGRKKGRETDRIEGVIPYVNCYGFAVFGNDSLSIITEKITTQAFLRVFRDKRLPFMNDRKKLPLEVLNSLPIGVDVQSVVLNKSYVQYEEFGEDADSSGYVFFDDLYATIENVNNLDLTRKGKTRLAAEAKFLGKAKVKVNATFPWNTAREHLVSGVIEELDMRSLNTMTEPAIQVRVESGNLKRAYFTFSASSTHSHGELLMDYDDLKLMTFKSEKRIKRLLKRRKPRNEEEDEKIRKSSLKSFLVNTFILGKRKDPKKPEGKRQGTIDFDRDMRKAIFNFWWKSLLSGVKSAYDIDKIEDSKLAGKLRKKDKG